MNDFIYGIRRVDRLRRNDSRWNLSSWWKEKLRHLSGDDVVRWSDDMLLRWMCEMIEAQDKARKDAVKAMKTQKQHEGRDGEPAAMVIEAAFVKTFCTRQSNK